MVRRRRDIDTSIAFAAADIFVLKGYPKKLSSLVTELQYVVIFPAVPGQSISRILEMKTARSALEFSKVYISLQLGVKLIETKIVQWRQLKESQTGSENKTGVWTYVGVASGATVLIILSAFSMICLIKR